jgi:hypothetical protein
MTAASTFISPNFSEDEDDIMDTAVAMPKPFTTPKRTPAISQNQAPTSNKKQKIMHTDTQDLLDLLDDATAENSPTPDSQALTEQVKTLTSTNTLLIEKNIALTSSLAFSETTHKTTINSLRAQISTLTTTHSLETSTLQTRISRQASTVKSQRT